MRRAPLGPAGADDRRPGLAADRALPRQVPRPLGRGLRARARARLPGARPVLPVPRCPLHEADLGRGLDGAERGARAGAGGLSWAGRQSARSVGDAVVLGVPHPRAALLAGGPERGARRPLEGRRSSEPSSASCLRSAWSTWPGPTPGSELRRSRATGSSSMTSGSTAQTASSICGTPPRLPPRRVWRSPRRSWRPPRSSSRTREVPLGGVCPLAVFELVQLGALRGICALRRFCSAALCAPQRRFAGAKASEGPARSTWTVRERVPHHRRRQGEEKR